VRRRPTRPFPSAKGRMARNSRRYAATTSRGWNSRPSSRDGSHPERVSICAGIRRGPGERRATGSDRKSRSLRSRSPADLYLPARGLSSGRCRNSAACRARRRSSVGGNEACPSKTARSASAYPEAAPGRLSPAIRQEAAADRDATDSRMRRRTRGPGFGALSHRPRNVSIPDRRRSRPWSAPAGIPRNRSSKRFFKDVFR